jgi:uncharacterized protein YkwD
LWALGARCRIDVVLRAPTGVIMTLLTAAVLLAACSSAPPAGPHGPAPTSEATPEATSFAAPDGVDLADPAQYGAVLEDGVNAARTQQDVPPLEHDDCLAAVAVERAEALVGAPELVHAPLPPVQRSCPGGTVAAENLSRTDRPPQDVVQAWLDSPSHRDNLVNAELLHGAIGCVRDGGTATAPVLTCSHVFLGRTDSSRG